MLELMLTLSVRLWPSLVSASKDVLTRRCLRSTTGYVLVPCNCLGLASFQTEVNLVGEQDVK